MPRSRSIIAHLVGHRPFTPIRSLKSQLIGNFVSIRGTVVRVSGVRPLVRRMDFECARCGDIQTIEFHDGKYAAPFKCKACKTKSMVAKRTEADSVDWQKIRY